MKRSAIPKLESQGAVAQIPFRSLKRIFDHSKVRFTANLKLALRTQTLDLRPFRFAKNGYQKFFNFRSREQGLPPVNREYPSIPFLPLPCISRHPGKMEQEFQFW